MKKPWNNECELCYGRHKFKVGDWMFRVTGHPYLGDAEIIVCQLCLFGNSKFKLLEKAQFKAD